MKNIILEERNVLVFYLMRAFSGFGALLGPVIYLFFTDKCNMSLEDVMYLQVFYAVLIMVLEVPSGYLADLFGRKKCVVIGSWLQVAACLVFGFADGIQMCFVAEALFGFADAFESGANKALLSSSLRRLGRKKEYLVITGKAQAVSYGVTIIACLLGGFLGQYDLASPFLLLAFLSILRALIAHFYFESALSFSKEKRQEQSCYEAITFCFYYNLRAGWLIFVGGASFGLLILAFWTYVPYFELSGLDYVYFGFLFAVMNVVSGITSFYTGTISEYLGERYSHMAIWITLILGIGMSTLFPGLIGVVAICTLLSFVRGFSEIFVGHALDKVALEKYRATILSLCSLFGRTFQVFFVLSVDSQLEVSQIIPLWKNFFMIAFVCAVVIAITSQMIDFRAKVFLKDKV